MLTWKPLSRERSSTIVTKETPRPGRRNSFPSYWIFLSLNGRELLVGSFRYTMSICRRESAFISHDPKLLCNYVSWVCPCKFYLKIPLIVDEGIQTRALLWRKGVCMSLELVLFGLLDLLADRIVLHCMLGIVELTLNMPVAYHQVWF